MLVPCVLVIILLHIAQGSLVEHTECRLHTYKRNGDSRKPLPLKCDYVDHAHTSASVRLNEEDCWSKCTGQVQNTGLHYKGISYVGTKERSISQDALDFTLHQVRNSTGAAQNTIFLSVLDGHGESGHIVADIASAAQHLGATLFVKRNVPFTGKLEYFKDMLIGIYRFVFDRLRMEQSMLPQFAALQTSGSTITTVALVSTEVVDTVSGTSMASDAAAHAGDRMTTKPRRTRLKWDIAAYNLGDSRAVLIETPTKHRDKTGTVKYRTSKSDSQTKIPGIYLTNDYNFASVEERLATVKHLGNLGYIFIGSFLYAANREAYTERDELLLWSKDVENDPSRTQFLRETLFNMLAKMPSREDAFKKLKTVAAQLKCPLYLFDYKSFVRTPRKGLRANPFVGSSSSDPRYLLQRVVAPRDVHMPHAFTEKEADGKVQAAWYLLKIGDGTDSAPVLGVQPSSSLGDFELEPIIRSTSMLSHATLVPSDNRDTILIVATDGLWERLDTYFMKVNKIETAGIDWIWKNAVYLGPKKLGVLLELLHENSRKAGSADDVTIAVLWFEDAAIDFSDSPPRSLNPGEGEQEKLLDLIAK